MAATNRDVDDAILGLLASLRLEHATSLRLYRRLHACLAEILAAVEAGAEWSFQLIDRRYARWPGCERQAYDAREDADLDCLPGRPVESLAYDLAELVRRRREAGPHGPRTA